MAAQDVAEVGKECGSGINGVRSALEEFPCPVSWLGCAFLCCFLCGGRALVRRFNNLIKLVTGSPRSEGRVQRQCLSQCLSAFLPLQGKPSFFPPDSLEFADT